MKVKVAAAKAIAAFLSSIEDEDFVKNFAQTLPIMIQTLIDAVKQDEDSGVTTIQSISDLIESHPNFVQPIIEDLLDIMTQIFKNKGFTDGKIEAIFCL
jgi:hypothetical protein